MKPYYIIIIPLVWTGEYRWLSNLMLMSKDVTEELLRRYLAGECTPAEEERVNAWYQELDGKSDVSGIIDLIDDEGIESRILDNVRSQIGAFPQPEISLPARMAQARPARSLWRYAAVILILITAGVGTFYFADKAINQVESSEIRQVANAENIIRRVALPDGSILWLYPNSAVEFPNMFHADRRNLTLRGEAFFVVARDESRPFTINTAGVVTTVLGTSFSIKAYDHEPSIEVQVMTGKVSVGLSDNVTQPVLLTSHEKATYLKGNSTVEKKDEAEVVETQLAIWEPVDMKFDNASVGSVLQALNEKFKVRIHVTKTNILNCLIRADFNEQNLPDILEMLSKSINATYKYEGNIFYLEGEGCFN